MCLKTYFLNCHPCMFGAAKITAEGNVKGTVMGTVMGTVITEINKINLFG